MIDAHVVAPGPFDSGALVLKAEIGDLTIGRTYSLNRGLQE